MSSFVQQIADPDSTLKMESGSFTMSAVWDCPESEWQTNHSGRENGWGVVTMCWPMKLFDKIFDV